MRKIEWFLCARCGKLMGHHEKMRLFFNGCYPVCYGHCTCPRSVK